MRKCEIRTHIQKHRESLVVKPTAKDLPRAGDVDFDHRMREFRQWQEEYNYDQQCCQEFGIPLDS